MMAHPEQPEPDRRAVLLALAVFALTFAGTALLVAERGGML